MLWFAAALTVAIPLAAALPPDNLNVKLAAPVDRWDEGVPLGNGLLGGILWGQGNVVRLSLDRADLWDTRPADGVPWDQLTYRNLQRLVAEGRHSEISRIFDAPYSDTHPTKLPAGRLELLLPPETQVASFELDLVSATAVARLSGEARIHVFFDATRPVALMRLRGVSSSDIGLRLLPPQAVRALGYPEARTGHEKHPGGQRSVWFVQDTAQPQAYCVCAALRPTATGALLAVTVAAAHNGHEALAAARRLIKNAVAEGWQPAMERHKRWWAAFWSASAVSLPDEAALRHYYFVEYLYGAGSRLGAPPMPLQGVWTADSGGLPPWKGDYHNDLNTQMTYIAYQTAGHFDEGRCFLDFLWNLLPRFREFARWFYDAPGAAVPGVMAIDGQPLGGWAQYSLSPTMGAWLAHLFYLHWRYTADAEFLRHQAYPWCREVAQCLAHLLRPSADGFLKLPLSTSPEVFENGPRAWLKPNSNFDLACLKMLFLALEEMAKAGAAPFEARRWRRMVEALEPFHIDNHGALMLDSETHLTFSHRHLSNLMPIHPFNLITVDGGGRDRRVIEASLKHWEKLGTKAWVGYAFSWMACVQARAGRGDDALRYLDIYLRAFILRNGFHCNGDQSGQGYSNFRYRPFTLEGNFLAAQAVQEMLLQSWSPTPGTPDSEVIRIFPAVPSSWATASFSRLRAEGGHLVSARREDGRTVWFEVIGGRDGVVRVRDNFGGRSPRWSIEGVRRDGRDFLVPIKRGEPVQCWLQ